MTLIVKHFNIYLPTGWEVSKYPVQLHVTSDAIKLPSSMVYDMRLFTVEQKRLRFRHKLFNINYRHLSCNEDFTLNVCPS